MISMLEGSEQEGHYSRFCRRIISLDRSIAYAGLADKFGSLVTAAFRETPLAGDKDAEQYSMQSAVSALITEHFEDNAGKARYQVTFYEKKARAVVPLVLAGRTYVLTMVGDLDPDLATIMADKVMPFLSSRQNA
jgi:hypothetical protein